VGKYPFPERARSSGQLVKTRSTRIAAARLEKDTMTGHGLRSSGRLFSMRTGGRATRSSGSSRVLSGNGVPAAYNYAEHLPEQRKIMQTWADPLDSLERRAK
jgi:hypothetical protein